MKYPAEEITQIAQPFKQDGKRADNNRKLFKQVHNHLYDAGRRRLLRKKNKYHISAGNQVSMYPLGEVFSGKAATW